MDRDAVLIATEADVTPVVLAAMARTPDPRLREIMTSLVSHLHQFAKETRITEPELADGLRWLVALGQHTTAANNEAVLASDVFGLSTLIDLINNTGEAGETMSALLGPFYRGAAPTCTSGECLARSDTPGSMLYFRGQVTELDGAPIAGAVLDVWHASPVGYYENQDAAQADFNLRGKFATDASGRFHFSTVRPAGYPVPINGPVGDLLRAQWRKPMRPAHIHFIISAPGHKTLITQVFFDTAEALSQDVVFGAKQQLVANLVEYGVRHPDFPDAAPPFYSCDYHFTLLPGTPRFPVPPISGKASA
ncbi:MAG TPA: dioxygenase [Dongiaceae bacterium]|nr:dioxygenase [Dongiaceae bacterium]